MEFSRQEYWSGLPFPSPGHLPDPGIKPGSPTLQADSSPSEPPGKSKIFVKVILKVRKVCLDSVSTQKIGGGTQPRTGFKDTCLFPQINEKL